MDRGEPRAAPAAGRAGAPAATRPPTTSPPPGRCSAGSSTPATPGSRSRPSTAAAGSRPPTSGPSARRPPTTSRPTSASPAASRSGRSPARCWPTRRRSSSQRHIPKILSGEEIWCQFYSEPEAGSDLAGIRTRATRDGDHWILNGSKIWSSGAYYADWAMCLARTDWDVPKHRGLTWFAVPTDADGRDDQPDHPDQRQRRVLRGVPRRRRRHRRRHHRRGQPGLGRHPDDARVRAGRRRVERDGARAARPGARSRRARPARRAHRRSDRPPGDRPGPHQRLRPAPPRAPDRGPACARRPRPTRPSPPTASWRPGMFTPIRARLALEIGGSEALAWAKGDDAAQRPAVDYLNGRQIAIAAGTNEMQRNGIGERVPRPAARAELRHDQAVQRGAAQLPQLERQGRLRSAGRPPITRRRRRRLRLRRRARASRRWRRPASRRRTAAVTTARRPRRPPAGSGRPRAPGRRASGRPRRG